MYTCLKLLYNPVIFAASSNLSAQTGHTHTHSLSHLRVTVELEFVFTFTVNPYSVAAHFTSVLFKWWVVAQSGSQEENGWVTELHESLDTLLRLYIRDL